LLFCNVDFSSLDTKIRDEWSLLGAIEIHLTLTLNPNPTPNPDPTPNPNPNHNPIGSYTVYM